MRRPRIKPLRLEAALQASVPVKTKARRIDWGKADWTLSNVEIAEQLGAHQSSVAYRRRVAGASQSPNRYKHRVKPSLSTTFKGVDWKQPDYIIAGEVGVSRQRVEQVRKL